MVNLVVFFIVFIFFLIVFSIYIIKKYNFFYIFFVIFVLVGFGIYIMYFNNIDDVGGSIIADGFSIESYYVLLDVKEDNKIDVTEKIRVNWYEDYHHGIYKFTPCWLEYTSKDGRTIKRKSNIINYRAEGDLYTIDTVKRKKRIKIGDPSEYVSLGNKDYIIKYTYDMGADPYKGFDEFIFHAYGDYWGTNIKNATLEVNMPKSINNYNINFFNDKHRKNNITEFVDFYITDNKLVAKYNDIKNGGQYLNNSLTLDIELPDNYFVGGSNNYGYVSIIMILIIVLITLIIIIMWYKYGKNYPKRVSTVEFYPPDDYTSAEIGCIYNKQTSNKLTISLIIELASKGYIKIDELNKNKIQITNLVSKYRNSNVNKRIIRVKKMKEIDNGISSDGVVMMNYLFKDSDIKNLHENIDNFLKVKDELIIGGYIQIENDTEKANQLHINNYDELPKLKQLEKIVYDRLFENGDVTILSENKTFYHAFSEVNNLLAYYIYDLINDKNSNIIKYLSMILNFIVIILYFISYLVEDLNPCLYILYLIPLICIFVNLFFIMIMKRKTIYGEEISARILGFRNYLIKVEKEKIELLVEKDPMYFYKILPYTYVLGISKKWIKKFENIPFPNVDMGNFNYKNNNSLYNIYDNVYRPTYSSNSGSSSGGYSSCGGGCSSCGGGCSSCGGGGSW